jgi:STE24 endopeptidase
MGNTILYIITVILLVDYIADRILDLLNRKNWSTELPKELEDIYDPEKYRRSQEYLRINSNFSLLTSTLGLSVMLLMLYTSGFALLDRFVRSYTENPILMALIYFAILGLGSGLLGLPFSLYRTFVIEEKFGFNKTTFKTWISDLAKGALLAVSIGGAIISLIVYIWHGER